MLPNVKSLTGLHELETKIKGFGLANIRSQMKTEKVILRLPKFKVEYSIDLREALEHVCYMKFSQFICH